ncbi:hypothetical protein, partial [uncultured Bilophila sp.]|uniref:hypothetical protein n=1 Tax=uncultured Bilophila sp. TaxID=529385 RepID=UPI00280A68C7
PLEGSCNTKGPLLVIFLELQPVSATRTHNSNTPKTPEGRKTAQDDKTPSARIPIALRRSIDAGRTTRYTLFTS